MKKLITISFMLSMLFLMSASDKVPLGIYYNSISSRDAIFMANFINEIQASNLLTLVDLHLSPWGNETLKCQNDQNDCVLNTFVACAINVWQDQANEPIIGLQLTFIHCLEYLVANRTLSQWDTCFEPTPVGRTQVDECYRSGQGAELENQYAIERAALNPLPEYTPWIVVDGKPLYQDFYNWMSYVCGAYKGSPTPDACSKAKSQHRIGYLWTSVSAIIISYVIVVI